MPALKRYAAATVTGAALVASPLSGAAPGNPGISHERACLHVLDGSGEPLYDARGAVGVVVGDEPPALPKPNGEATKDDLARHTGIDVRRPVTDPEQEPSVPVPPLDSADREGIARSGLAC